VYGRAIQFANRQIDLAYGNAGRPVLTSRLVPKSQLLRPTVDRYDYRLCRTNSRTLSVLGVGMGQRSLFLT